MSLNLINKKLDNKIASFYKEYGFTYDPEVGACKKEDQEVLWSIINKYPTYIITRPTFLLKSKEIVIILDKLFPNDNNLIIRKIQGRDLARELGCNDYDHLAHPRYDIDRGVAYKIDENTVIENIIKDHSIYMDKVGFLFFEKVRTLEGVNDFINKRILDPSMEILTSEPYKEDLLKFFTNYEIRSGIIVAHLVKNRRIKELVDRYRLVFVEYENILADIEKIEYYFKETLDT